LEWFERARKKRVDRISAALEGTKSASVPILNGEEGVATPVETSILGGLARLHPFSPVAVAVLQLLDREQSSTHEIARLLQSDPAMAAETLAYVNSPLFPLRANITELHQAVLVLGAENTRRLTTTLAMRGFLKSAPNRAVTRRFWRHSLATGLIAAELAPIYGVAPDLANTAGVLHDIGRVGLLARNTAEYARVVFDLHDNVEAILTAEREACGMDHCAAGMFLCRVWALPAVFQEVASLHHRVQEEMGICSLIHTACALADDMKFAAISHRGVLTAAERIVASGPERLREKVSTMGAAFEKRIAERIDQFDV
jgi:HD-like signal output (HDOD) protein